MEPIIIEETRGAVKEIPVEVRFFEGRVENVKVYPFCLKPWEMAYIYKHSSPEGDYFQIWFRVWLKMRRVWQRR